MITTQIRWLIRRDMDAVQAIENASFSHPWSGAEWAENLKERDTIGTVIEDDLDILGYAIYKLGKTKFELLNMAVKPIERRCGHGRQMINRLKGKLDQQHRTAIECTVTEENLQAQLFLQACGFTAVRVVKDAWNGSDAYRFRYRIKEQA
jgi:ribosomal-protein-alanine N-acetyltransferase